jgi:hypothetical protein
MNQNVLTTVLGFVQQIESIVLLFLFELVMSDVNATLNQKAEPPKGDQGKTKAYEQSPLITGFALLLNFGHGNVSRPLG